MGQGESLSFFYLVNSLLTPSTEDSPCAGLPGLSASPGRVPNWRSEDCPMEADEGGGESGGGAQ